MTLAQRIPLALLAITLLAAAAVSMRWAMIDGMAVDADRVLNRSYQGLADQGEFEAARAGLDALLELRPHPTYLDRLARFELEAGSRARNDDPVAAFRHFNRAEELALAAHAVRPGAPHILLWAAAARAERFQFDAVFEGYLEDAARIGPWDRAVFRTSILLILQRWHAVPEHLREQTVDRAEEAWRHDRGGDLRRMITQTNLWAVFCERDVIREHNPRQCQPFEAPAS